MIRSLILAFFAASHLFAQVPSNSAKAEELRVMSFNVRYANGGDGQNHWRFRKTLVAQAIRSFDPDLLGTQEVMADQFDDLHRIFPDYLMVGVAREDGVRKGEWSAILYRSSRFERIDSGNFWLSATPDHVGSKSWDAAEPRICTWAKLRDRSTRRELLFANTHLDNAGPTSRILSAKLLSERLPQLAKGSPVILCGDFNCTEDSEPYKRLVDPSSGGALKLSDSYRVLHPDRSKDEATFHGFTGSIAGSRIDWILHSSDFRPASAEIIRSGAAPFPSDHFPVTAVFRMKN